MSDRIPSDHTARKKLTVGSLFSGIGGMDLGLERAGMEIVFQVEKDEFCRRVLAKHWPDVRRCDDVSTFFAGDGWVADDWRCDLLCGGFPCQDISTARTSNRRLGLGGERSGLWREFARVIGIFRPAWVLVENSPAWQRWTAAVCEDLCGLGYCPTPLEVEASLFGAPFRRRRVFVVAHAHGDGESTCPFDEEAFGVSEAPEFSGHWRQAAPVGVGMADGISAELVLRAYGNAVAPQVAEWIGRRIIEAAERGGDR